MERLALLLVAAAFPSQGSNSPGSTLPGLPEAAATAWERYRQFIPRLQGTITYEFSTVDSSRNGGLPVQWCVVKQVRQRPGAALWREKKESPEGEEQVVLTNRQYSCSLRRRTGTDQWLLEQIVYQYDARLPELDGTVSESIRGMTSGHYVLLGDYLPDALKSNAIRIIRIDPAYSMEGRTFTRIDFVSNPKGGSRKPPDGGRLRDGWVVLDPEAGWCIREETRRYVYADGVKESRSRFDYTINASGYPILRQHRNITQGQTDGGATFRFEVVRHLELSESDDPPEREFTLSAFGLPEPVGVVQERRTPVYVWLLVAAGVLLTLGVFFRWLARRLRRGHSEG